MFTEMSFRHKSTKAFYYNGLKVNIKLIENRVCERVPCKYISYCNKSITSQQCVCVTVDSCWVFQPLHSTYAVMECLYTVNVQSDEQRWRNRVMGWVEVFGSIHGFVWECVSSFTSVFHILPTHTSSETHTASH